MTFSYSATKAFAFEQFSDADLDFTTCKILHSKIQQKFPHILAQTFWHRQFRKVTEPPHFGCVRERSERSIDLPIAAGFTSEHWRTQLEHRAPFLCRFTISADKKMRNFTGHRLPCLLSHFVSEKRQTPIPLQQQAPKLLRKISNVTTMLPTVWTLVLLEAMCEYSVFCWQLVQSSPHVRDTKRTT